MYKNSLFFLILFGIFNLVSAQSCLIANYPLNGNAIDISGNGNTGMLFGPGTASDRFGNPNQVLSFDGINDYVELNDTLGNFGSSDFSISVWINTTSLDQEKIISKRATCSNANQWNLFLKQGRASFSFEQVNPYIYIPLSSNTLVNDGFWHNVVVVREGIDLRIYVDCSLDTIGSSSGIINANNNAVLKLGTGPCVGVDVSEAYQGLLDDLAFFNCALSLNDITTLCQDSSGFCTVFDTVTIYNTVYDTITVYDTTEVTNFISVTDTLIVDVVLSTNPLNINQIKVYPNPTNNLLVIDNGNYQLMSSYRAKIANGNGQEIFNSLINVPSFAVDLNQFGANGLYFLQIIDSNNQIIAEKKILLQ